MLLLLTNLFNHLLNVLLNFVHTSKKAFFIFYLSNSSHPHALLSVVGKSIAYLNGLETRAKPSADGKSAQITDIVEFLCGSWGASYFHDEFFPSLVESLKNDPALIEKVRALDEAKKADPSKDIASLIAENPGIVGDLDLYVLSYLQDTREMSKIYHYYMPEDAASANPEGLKNAVLGS